MRLFGIYGMICIAGAAALSWEILWQLKFSLALGASAIGMALVLANFMIGLLLGAIAVTKFVGSENFKRPLLAYGICELIIGFSGAAFLPSMEWIEALDSELFLSFPANVSYLGHILAISLIVLLPSAAMGATVPILGSIGRFHGAFISRLYSVNTLGALFGVLVTSFLILPAVGVVSTTTILVVIDFIVGTLALLLSFKLEKYSSREEGANQVIENAAKVSLNRADETGLPLMLQVVICFVTGFGTFALEVAWSRALRAVFWSTSQTFALLLAAVLLAISLGAYLARYTSNDARTVKLSLQLVALSIFLSALLIASLENVIANLSFLSVPLKLILSIVLLGPTFVSLSIPLPLFLDQVQNQRHYSLLYGVNTLGGFIGALGAAWLLLPTMGFHVTACVIGVVFLSVSLFIRASLAPTTFIVTLPLLALAVANSWQIGRTRAMGLSFYGPYKLLDYREGPDSTFVVANVFGDSTTLFIDGFAAAGEWGTTQYMAWMGHIPAIFRQKLDHALVICFGTGQTANAVRREGVNKLDIVDLNRTVFDLAPHFKANEDVLKDPVVNSIVMDGRAWLRRSPTLYDLITLEPLPPNHSGVNSLYSLEFYQLASSRLRDGGTIAQWLPAHLVSTEHARAIAKTFFEVFPVGALWIHPEDHNGILLGIKTASRADIMNYLVQQEQPAVNRSMPLDKVLANLLLRQPEERKTLKNAQIITDDNQLLAFGDPLERRHELGRLAKNAIKELLE